jgi:hypothetical protein
MSEFEKNIKQQASGYLMDPDPGSFEQVMTALSKKKKNRFILILCFLLPLTLVAGSGAFIFNYFGTKDAQVTIRPLLPKDKISSSKKTKIAAINQQVADNKNSNYKNKLPNQSFRFSDSKKINEVKKQTSQSKKHSTRSTKDVNQIIYQPEEEHDTTLLNNEDEQKQFHQPDTLSTNQQKENKRFTLESNQTSNDILNKRIVSTPFQLSSNSWLKLPVSYSLPTLTRVDTPFVLMKRPDKIRRWSLGGYAQFGMTRNMFSANEDTTAGYSGPPYNSYYTNARKNTDKFLLGYSVGITVRFVPIKFLAIETGIGFSHYESNQVIYPASTSPNPGEPSLAWTQPGAVGGSTNYHNVYDYLTIPLHVYYQKKWNLIGIESGAGINFEIPVHTKSYTETVISDSSGAYYISKFTDNIKDSPLTFSVQAQVNFHLVFHVKKFSFYIGPAFKYRINSMFNDAYVIRQHSYLIGLETGVNYHF